MIELISQSGHIAYGLKRFVVDEPADINNLSIDEKMGSTAYVISTGDIYMINSRGQWIQQKQSNNQEPTTKSAILGEALLGGEEIL